MLPLHLHHHQFKPLVVKQVMNAFRASCAKKNDRGGFSLLSFIADKTRTGKVLPEVMDHIHHQEAIRKGPSQTPRTFEEVSREIANDRA